GTTERPIDLVHDATQVRQLGPGRHDPGIHDAARISVDGAVNGDGIAQPSSVSLGEYRLAQNRYEALSNMLDATNHEQVRAIDRLSIGAINRMQVRPVNRSGIGAIDRMQVRP